MPLRADMYREKAAEAKNRAAEASNPHVKSAFKEVARGWLLLAEQMVTRPLGSSGGAPILQPPISMGVPETPPEPSFGLCAPHGRAGFSFAKRTRRQALWRSNGRDWTEGFTHNRLERSPLRRHYVTSRL